MIVQGNPSIHSSLRPEVINWKGKKTRSGSENWLAKPEVINWKGKKTRSDSENWLAEPEVINWKGKKTRSDSENWLADWSQVYPGYLSNVSDTFSLLLLPCFLIWRTEIFQPYLIKFNTGDVGKESDERRETKNLWVGAEPLPVYCIVRIAIAPLPICWLIRLFYSRSRWRDA